MRVLITTSCCRPLAARSAANIRLGAPSCSTMRIPRQPANSSLAWSVRGTTWPSRPRAAMRRERATNLGKRSRPEIAIVEVEHRCMRLGSGRKCLTDGSRAQAPRKPAPRLHKTITLPPEVGKELPPGPRCYRLRACCPHAPGNASLKFRLSWEQSCPFTLFAGRVVFSIIAVSSIGTLPPQGGMRRPCPSKKHTKVRRSGSA